MKEFLATWIILQLLAIGYVGAGVEWEMENNVYDCSVEEISKHKYQVSGVIFPLTMFTELGVKDYCESKR